MKRILAGITACAVVALASAAFAQQTQSLTAEVYFTAPQTTTTFALYTTETGSTPWTEIELDNGDAGDIEFNSNVKYYAAGSYWVDVDPGNYGKWYLCVYTANAYRPAPDPNPFNPENGSNLFNTDDSGKSCVWKYTQSASFGEAPTMVGMTVTGITKATSAVITVNDTTGLAVGDTISLRNVTGMTEINNKKLQITALTGTTITVNLDTSGSGYTMYALPNTGVVSRYFNVGDIVSNAQWTVVGEGAELFFKYFANLADPKSAADFADEDTRRFASLVNYMTDFDYNNRVSMGFAIDMNSVIRVGTYSTTVVFEVYYKP